MAVVGSSDDVALLRARNIRDLGGLPTRGSLVIAPGRFFRGSDPSQLGRAERLTLARLNLRSVVDLRTQAEADRSSNAGLIPGAEVFHLPLFETARPNWVAPADQTPRAAAVRYVEMLGDGLHALANIVVQVGQPRTTPFLVCCAAGRDRTGIVVACLLDLLEVSDEAIASDYAQSDFFDQQGGRSYPATILEFLALMRDRYGSTTRMLFSVGVPVDVVERLRRDLLVPVT
jgi:protein-tyrosine phosphatase